MFLKREKKNWWSYLFILAYVFYSINPTVSLWSTFFFLTTKRHKIFFIIYCNYAWYLQSGAFLSKPKVHASTFTESVGHCSSSSETIWDSPKTVVTTISSCIVGTNHFLWIMFVNGIRPICLIMMMSMNIINIFFVTTAGTQIIIFIFITDYGLFWIIICLMMMMTVGKNRSWTLLW